MLVQQNSLTILINKVLGQSAKTRKGGSQLLYHCPFCKEHKRNPKLEICLDQSNFGRWNCWICNTHGGSVAHLFRKMKSHKSYFVELFSITKDVSVLKQRTPNNKSKENIVLPNEFKSLAVPSLNPDYKRILYYLKSRGLTRDDILRYNIGYCESGEYRNRIVFPSYDVNGDLNFFVTRTYNKNSEEMPYKNCPYSKNIIGFELFVNWNEAVTLTEGCFDAASIRRNAIPLFGKVMSSALKGALIDNGVTNVNVCLDNDALRDSLHISQFLIANGIEVNLVKLDDKDPSKMGFNSVYESINLTKSLDFSDIISIKMNL